MFQTNIKTQQYFQRDVKCYFTNIKMAQYSFQELCAQHFENKFSNYKFLYFIQQILGFLYIVFLV